MRSPESITRSNRNCGRFFVFLAAFSLVLAYFYFYVGQWGLGLSLMPGVVFFGAIGWWAIAGPCLRDERGGNRDDGFAGAGKPVPSGPVPPHHLVAAKDLPPSDNTHCFAKD